MFIAGAAQAHAAAMTRSPSSPSSLIAPGTPTSSSSRRGVHSDRSPPGGFVPESPPPKHISRAFESNSSVVVDPGRLPRERARMGGRGVSARPAKSSDAGAAGHREPRMPDLGLSARVAGAKDGDGGGRRRGRRVLSDVSNSPAGSSSAAASAAASPRLAPVVEMARQQAMARGAVYAGEMLMQRGGQRSPAPRSRSVVGMESPRRSSSRAAAVPANTKQRLWFELHGDALRYWGSADAASSGEAWSGTIGITKCSGIHSQSPIKKTRSSAAADARVTDGGFVFIVLSRDGPIHFFVDAAAELDRWVSTLGMALIGRSAPATPASTARNLDEHRALAAAEREEEREAKAPTTPRRPSRQPDPARSPRSLMISPDAPSEPPEALPGHMRSGLHEAHAAMVPGFVEQLKNLATQPANSSTGWQYVRATNGVSLYRNRRIGKMVKSTPSSTVMIRGETEVQASIEELEAFFKDVQSLKVADDQIVEVVELEKVSDTSRVVWARYNTPFPMKKRDFVWYDSVLRTADGALAAGGFSIDGHPRKAGLVRGQMHAAGYIAFPLAARPSDMASTPSRTGSGAPAKREQPTSVLHYVAQLDLQGGVPTWVQNTLALQLGDNCRRVREYFAAKHRLDEATQLYTIANSAAYAPSPFRSPAAPMTPLKRGSASPGSPPVLAGGQSPGMTPQTPARSPYQSAWAGSLPSSPAPSRADSQEQSSIGHPSPPASGGRSRIAEIDAPIPMGSMTPGRARDSPQRARRESVPRNLEASPRRPVGGQRRGSVPAARLGEEGAIMGSLVDGAAQIMSEIVADEDYFAVSNAFALASATEIGHEPAPEANLLNMYAAVRPESSRVGAAVFVAAQWQPDKDAKACAECSSSFGMFTRRHHCRRCGGLFCGDCSDQEADLSKFGQVGLQRVCGTCYRAGDAEELLLLSMAMQDTATAAEALAAGADPNLCANQRGDTPLHMACHVGDIALVNALVRGGAAPNSRELVAARTPLHVACQSASPEQGTIVRSLLRLGSADPNKQDQYGWTALHLCARYNRLPAAVALLEEGQRECAPPDLDAADLICFRTPLQTAAAEGHAGIVGAILGTAGGRERIDAVCVDGCTPLHLGCRYGRLDVVGVLLDAGADLHRRTGATPSSDRGDGDDRNAADSWAPIHYAARYGHEEILLKLLQRGADVSQETLLGETVLSLAMKKGHAGVVAAVRRSRGQ